MVNLPPRDNYGRFMLNLKVKSQIIVKPKSNTNNEANVKRKEVKIQEPLKKCRSLKDLNNL